MMMMMDITSFYFKERSRGFFPGLKDISKRVFFSIESEFACDENTLLGLFFFCMERREVNTLAICHVKLVNELFSNSQAFLDCFLPPKF